MQRYLHDPPTRKRVVARSAFSSPQERRTLYGTNTSRWIEALQRQRHLEQRRPLLNSLFRYVPEATWFRGREATGKIRDTPLVYFLAAQRVMADAIQVGCTVNYLSRRKDLRGDIKSALILVAAALTARHGELEQGIHGQFHDHLRYLREWFSKDAVLGFLKDTLGYRTQALQIQAARVKR